jgi:hypothetical protein
MPRSGNYSFSGSDPHCTVTRNPWAPRRATLTQPAPFGLFPTSNVSPFFSSLDPHPPGYSIQMKAGIAQADLPGLGALEIEGQVVLVGEANSTVNLNP